MDKVLPRKYEDPNELAERSIRFSTESHREGSSDRERKGIKDKRKGKGRGVDREAEKVEEVESLEEEENLEEEERVRWPESEAQTTKSEGELPGFSGSCPYLVPTFEKLKVSPRDFRE